MLGKRVLKRFLAAAGTPIFVIIFNFFLFRILPGDLTTVIIESQYISGGQAEADRGFRPRQTAFHTVRDLYQPAPSRRPGHILLYMYDNSTAYFRAIAGRIPNTVRLLLTAESNSHHTGHADRHDQCAHKRATPLLIPGYFQDHLSCIQCRPSGLPCC